MAKKKKQEELSASQKFGIGIGLTTAAVAAAGAYFLYGSENAEQNRKKVRGWMLKAKGDVLERMEDAKHMTEEEFFALVDKVAMSYDKARSLSKKELKDFRNEMADNWQELVASGVTKVLSVEQIAKQKAKAKKTVKKTTKKAAKTTTKKAAKKTTKKVAKQ
jgi:DNA repair protein RadC